MHFMMLSKGWENNEMRQVLLIDVNTADMISRSRREIKVMLTSRFLVLSDKHFALEQLQNITIFI